MNQPKVSVIIPVYNTEKYLRECLDSAVNQTLKDIEIICVDDGSTDGSSAILEEYREKDSRISVITQPNSGPSAARNKGLACAHGKYIDFLDSDDLLLPNTMEATVEIAEKENLDAILFELEPFYESEQLAQNPPVRYKHISEATGIMSGVQYMKSMQDQGTYTVNVVPALWRRAFLEEHNIRFQEGIIHEDHLFSFYAYMAAGRVKRIPDRFLRRRVREKSIMTSPKSAKNVIGYYSSAIAVIKYALDNADPDKEQEIKREYTQMLGMARRDYLAISDGEKEKICFASELENELFNQLIKDRARLEASNERQKLRAETFQRDLGRQTEQAETLQRDLENQRKQAEKLQYELDSVHNSVSFRIGRAVTWLPRKLRVGARCFRDHGVGYTIRRALYRLGLWKDQEKD